MTLPSKELMSEVLGKPIGRIEYEEDVRYFYAGTDTFCGQINIYEFAHMCKEWAFKQGYDLVCKRKYTLTRSTYYECNVEKLLNYIFYFEAEFSSEQSEQEAIFKACEWIKDNKCTS